LYYTKAEVCKNGWNIEEELFWKLLIYCVLQIIPHNRNRFRGWPVSRLREQLLSYLIHNPTPASKRKLRFPLLYSNLLLPDYSYWVGHKDEYLRNDYTHSHLKAREPHSVILC